MALRVPVGLTVFLFSPFSLSVNTANEHTCLYVGFLEAELELCSYVFQFSHQSILLVSLQTEFCFKALVWYWRVLGPGLLPYGFGRWCSHSVLGPFICKMYGVERADLKFPNSFKMLLRNARVLKGRQLVALYIESDYLNPAVNV